MRRCHAFPILALVLSSPAFAQVQDQAPRQLPTEVSVGNERDVEGLIATKLKEQQAIKALDGVDSLMPEDTASGPVALPGGRFGALLKNPVFARFSVKMLRNTKDPEFMKALVAMSKNRSLKWMYAALLAYTLLFALLKRRTMAATDRFFPRLVLRGIFTVLFVGGYLLVSYSFLGDPFVKVTTATFGAAASAVFPGKSF